MLVLSFSKHMSTVLIIKKNGIKTWKISQQMYRIVIIRIGLKMYVYRIVVFQYFVAIC